MSDEAHAKQVGDEMRLLYSTAVTEIAGFKRQVWHVTNASQVKGITMELPVSARIDPPSILVMRLLVI